MTSPLRLIIADDERAARAKLVRLLRAHDDIEVVAEAATGREMITAVRHHRPDLVLLDVRMTDLDGFEALRAMSGEALPKIIFVTAYDEFAVRAFDVRALDYVLKPFDASRLAEALARVREQTELEQRQIVASAQSVLDQSRDVPASVEGDEPRRETYVERICIQSHGRAQFVRLADVQWIEASGNYVRLHTATVRPLLREPLRRFVLRLNPERFARIHRSAIVSLDRIREMKPLAAGDYLVILDTGVRLRLSRSYRPEVDRRLGRR